MACIIKIEFHIFWFLLLMQTIAIIACVVLKKYIICCNTVKRRKNRLEEIVKPNDVHNIIYLFQSLINSL